MIAFDESLEWIATRQPAMVEAIERGCRINSGSRNPAGLAAYTDEVEALFTPLGVPAQRVALPAWEQVDDDGRPTRFETGEALVYRRRPDARRQVLLAIHLDTVFPPESAFQSVTRLDEGRLGGPGVADAKGGIVLLQTALEALERSAIAEGLGWTVVLNPDEEVGSPCSMGLLAELASHADFGLVFEPSLPDGAMISRRKGSGNFAIVVRGRAAHVGRAFGEGRSAIHALATLIERIARWNESLPGVIVNTGLVRGGGALNVVPDFALARVNLRVEDAAQQDEVTRRLEALADEVARAREVEIDITGAFLSPPKALEPRVQTLMHELERSGKEVGVELAWQPSGGVCDGNKLAAAGLPNVDTMGPQGGEIHSEREYLLLDSLVPRTQLCAALLMRYAAGDFEIESAAGREETG